MIHQLATMIESDSLLSPLRVFQYVTVRAGSALLLSFLVCVLFGDRVIRRLQKLQAIQPIRHSTGEGAKSLAEMHAGKKHVPTMGGIMIIGAVTAAMLLFGDLSSVVLWLAFFGMLAFGLVGFLDDYLKVVKKHHGGLPAKAKLAMQIAFGAAFAMIFAYVVPDVVSYRIDQKTTVTGPMFVLLPFLKDAVFMLGLLYIPFAIFVLTATTNAVNLTDGLDGLAAGVTISVTLCLAIAAYLVGRVDASQYLLVPHVRGAGELAVLLCALTGACFGFLWFNAHPAQVFMGDTGSMALGGLLGAAGLLIKMEYLLVIAGGVLVAETLSVILQVASWKLRRKRIFAMSPLHHHFECKGWAESKIITRFWIVSALFALSSLMTLKIR